jgi:hypothetical protein
VSSIVGYRNLPEEVRSLDTLAGPDYADVFTAAVIPPSGMSLQHWFHAMFPVAPAWVRVGVPFAQRVVLRLRLEPRSAPDHPAGWAIADCGDNWIRLEAASWLMTAHIVGKVDEGTTSVATFVRYERWPAAILWPLVAIGHRKVARTLMRHAIRRSAPKAVSV